ncbi:fat-like cadherin-related tumor suppressor homolog, partial [Saccostrea cucullata]|uniref:fat-like cadherin-related tumor suppressor homolog n=1 Tax=Saccostrea cuccullata TaxID=36930 RepID=UPI002ED558F6
CSAPNSNIAGRVFKSPTVAVFNPNSPLYRTDTTIEGVYQGTQTASGVNITFVRSQATPNDLNLNNLFELITLPVSDSPFGSGLFWLKSALKRDKDPTQTKFFLMQLEIRDINDNAPIFGKAPYSASVDELKVKARDQIRKPREVASAAEHIDELKDSGMLTFSANSYNVTISEKTPVGTSVTTLIASPGSSSSLRYEATGFGSATCFFHLSKVNGSIYVQNNLRFEKNIFDYILQVQAYDVAFPTDRVTTNVTIKIIRNENAPQFDKFQYTANISENIAINVIVLQLKATDKDTEDRITYGYDGANPVPFTRLFSLNPNTGIITVQADLTTDTQSIYKATVSAYDNSNPEKKTAVQVIISVYRDRSSPQFSVGNQTVTLSENTAIRTSVAALSATDADRVGVVTYEVTGVYPAPSLFSVHPTNGVVTIAKDLH